MSYPKQLLRLSPRRGIVSDVAAYEVGPNFWTQGDNCVFRQGFAERAPGTLEVYDPPQTAIYNLLNAQIGGINYWIYHSADKSHAVETSNHTDITHASGLQAAAETYLWTSGLLNGVPFANNSLDAPMYWDGDVGNKFVDLPDWPAGTVCNALVAHKYHLFALGIDGPSGDFPMQIKWSDAAAPGSVPAAWTAAADNEAGDSELAETPGALVTALSLRGSLMIYKNGATYVADYLPESDEIFTFRLLFSQAGALARHGVADVNGQHFIVTDGDIVLTDGVNIRSIAQSRRRRFLFNQLDQDNFRNIFAIYNRAQNEVWLGFPEAGESLCTRAMIYDVSNDAWGDRELPSIATAAPGIINDTAPDESWDSDSEVWDSDLTEWNRQSYSLATESIVLADPNTPDMLQVGEGSQSISSTLAKYGLTFDAPERLKFVKRVHVRMDAPTSVDFELRIATQMTPEGAITYTNPVTFNSDQQFINVIAQGRYIGIEIKATTDQSWSCMGVDIEAELRGYH